MLIDYESLHRTYLTGYSEGKVWKFNPTNPKDPRVGFFPSSYQVFSNNALQVSLYLYNSIGNDGECIAVSHCLYLSFTHKNGAKYLLNNDTNRIVFNLDLGIAGDLYGLSIGHSDEVTYRIVRAGKSPKTISGKTAFRDGHRVVLLKAESAIDGRLVSIEVEMQKAALIALAAHCIGYGRLLYPSLSDTAVQSLLSTPNSNSRACAENSDTDQATTPEGREELTGGGSMKPIAAQPQRRPVASSGEVTRLRKIIWAIGNQKWEKMTLPALQKIQRSEDAQQLQALIDCGNEGDFSAWDDYLS